MKKFVSLLIATILAFSVNQASAQITETTVVRAVLFTSPICTFCREIVERDLPPVIQGFGEQLEILHVDVNTPEGEKLYQAALEAFNVPRGVPLLFIGQTTLGGINITPQLPALVEAQFAQGGVGWPTIPGLDEFLALTQEIAVTSTSLPKTNSNQASQTNEGESVVRAVMFWMDGCSHCEDVIETVLPPIQEQYGAQFDLQLIEFATLDDVNRLYDISASYGFTKEQTGVPFLVIGETALVGADNIHERLPALIEQHLVQGGVEVPDILRSFMSLPTVPPVSEKTIVYIFWGDGCPHCEAARPFLRELAQRYPGVEILEYEIWYEIENQALFTRMAAKLGFEPRSVPTIFIGERYWEGFSDGMKAELENAVAVCAESGCPDAGLGIISDPAALPASQPEVSISTDMRDNGFALAIVIMIGMGIALLYSFVSFISGKSLGLPDWADWLIPILIVMGIGVAGYLSYVETQYVEAMCGPIGDCNTVQQSSYARLFDILPIGVLGLMGYIALLAAWLAQKFIPKLEKPATIGFFGMTFFAVIFSLYLTYLEPFVIKAVCIWCLTSAVIVTLLLLLGTPPAVLQFSMSDEDD
jgi:uncharacterized membrane protein/thiol-disulfide isomerase/thioredoxin